MERPPQAALTKCGVDAHAHLDFKEFAPDLPAVIDAAEQAGVRHILTCGIDLPSSRAAIEIAERFPIVHAACGIHPHESEKVTDADLSELDALLTHPKAVAVGEIGLDFYYGFSSNEAQRRVFATMLKMALRHSKPVAVHSRAAEEECFRAVQDAGIPRAFFHCFTGSPETGRCIQKAGYCIGATGILTFNNPSNAELIASLDPFMLMTETDAPFLAPKPFRGKRNEPAHISLVFAKLLQLFPTVTETKLRDSILNNYRVTFSLA
ncbi:MAG: TatD family hydrolase [Fibrobacterota bacterium]